MSPVAPSCPGWAVSNADIGGEGESDARDPPKGLLGLWVEVQMVSAAEERSGLPFSSGVCVFKIPDTSPLRSTVHSSIYWWCFIGVVGGKGGYGRCFVFVSFLFSRCRSCLIGEEIGRKKVCTGFRTQVHAPNFLQPFPGSRSLVLAFLPGYSAHEPVSYYRSSTVDIGFDGGISSPISSRYELKFQALRPVSDYGLGNVSISYFYTL